MIIIYILSARSAHRSLESVHVAQLKYIKNTAKNADAVKISPYPRSCYICRHDQCTLLSPRELLELKCERKLPELFIVGAPRCGTNALGKFMDLHPSLMGASFGVNPGHEEEGDDIQNIAGIMTHQMGYTTPGQIAYLTNPDFFTFDMNVLKQLSTLLQKDAKLIIMLRNPVQRAVSEYFHVKKLMKQNPEMVRTEWIEREMVDFFENYEMRETFESTVLDENGNVRQEIQIINTGIYINHISSYLDTFQLRQMLILDGDVFVQDPLVTLREVVEFLHIPRFYTSKHFIFTEENGYYCANIPSRPDVQCIEHDEGSAHEDIDRKVIDKLSEFYKPYTMHLQNLVGKRFSWT